MPSTAHSHWTPGPDRPLLRDDTVHVWRADLTATGNDVGELLCDEEQARAARLLNERHRELWMRSRGVLRALLGRYLQTDPRTLRFAIGEHGKPALLAPPQSQPPPISFNLTHSNGLALYAFAAAETVGVDVELSRRAIDTVAIAARTFGPAEAQRLEGLDPVTRRREFLRAWVRHEAALKCLGVGIGGADAALSRQTPWIAELDVGPLGAAAVAAQTPPQALLCWDWPARAET